MTTWFQDFPQCQNSLLDSTRPRSSTMDPWFHEHYCVTNITMDHKFHGISQCHNGPLVPSGPVVSQWSPCLMEALRLLSQFFPLTSWWCFGEGGGNSPWRRIANNQSTQKERLIALASQLNHLEGKGMKWFSSFGLGFSSALEPGPVTCCCRESWCYRLN